MQMFIEVGTQVTVYPYSDSEETYCVGRVIERIGDDFNSIFGVKYNVEYETLNGKTMTVLVRHDQVKRTNES